MEVVTRAFQTNFETKKQDNKGTIRGRPVVLNSRTNLGDFDEVIDSRALMNTDLTDVRLCLNHDTSFVYARSRNNNANSTMRLTTDEQGLTFEADLAVDSSPKAQDYFAAIERRDIDKMSFMFTVDGVEWENLESDHPTRRITSIGKIFEISAVTFPAYDSTSIEARDKDRLDSLKRELESARKSRAAIETPDGVKKSLDLAKAKFEFYAKIGG